MLYAPTPLPRLTMSQSSGPKAYPHPYSYPLPLPLTPYPVPYAPYPSPGARSSSLTRTARTPLRSARTRIPPSYSYHGAVARRAPPFHPNHNQERNVSVVEEHAFVLTGASAMYELQPKHTDGAPRVGPTPHPHHPTYPGASCSCECAAPHRAGGTSSSSEHSSSGRRRNTQA